MHFLFIEEREEFNNGKGSSYVTYTKVSDGIEGFLSDFFSEILKVYERS